MDSQPSMSGRSLEKNSTSTPRSSNEVSKSSYSLTRSFSNAASEGHISILSNSPTAKHGNHSSDASWVGWWSSSTMVHPPEFAPLAFHKAGSDVCRSDFQQYLSSILDPFSRFEDIRSYACLESDNLENIGSQGEALLACLREVPALYFNENFSLEDGATFSAVCPSASTSDNLALQEKLSQYLDVVEVHLVKEISLRSNSFFEAQGQLHDLNVKIDQGCNRIRDLKETIRLLDMDLVQCALQVQELNNTKNNLFGLQEKLRLILYVNQAASALKLLVASADCAAALDVINDLKHLLDSGELTGLHCFRHLRDHLTTSFDCVNSILSVEFMHISLNEAGKVDTVILSNVKAKISFSTKLSDHNDEQASSLHDRLVPVIICLLRTAQLPSVLRMYGDRLTADMKTAIKTAVAELLPVLLAQFQDSDIMAGERATDTDGGGSSLAAKLRSLSAECFVHLLGSIFDIVQAHLIRAAKVKKVVECIVSNVDGECALHAVAATSTISTVATDSSQHGDLQVASLLFNSSDRGSAMPPSFQVTSSDTAMKSNFSRNFRVDVLRENTEALFAACDAAHGRWAKLLGVRAFVHQKLRLHDFLSIHSITQEFINVTEKIGGRLGYSIRGTLQSQAKAFVDFQHESRMTKLKAVLDQETWVEVDVPDEFQAIMNSILSYASVSTENTDQSVGGLISTTGAAVSNSSGMEATVLISNGSGNVNSNGDAIVPKAPSSNRKIDYHEKYASQPLSCKGDGYHMVNCGLILVKMISEYMDMNSLLPGLSAELVHRVVDILKLFNMRTYQLVLGAGAIQVAGLKSITAKHLALSSQLIGFIYSFIPDIRQALFLKVPEVRKMLLLSEFDRVAQDYKNHQVAIHTKLIQMMRDRLMHHMRGLPQILEGWNKTERNNHPSQFARSLTKEVGYVERVLSRVLHEEDVEEIFRQVVIIFDTQLGDAIGSLEITTEQAKNGLCRDVHHILECLRSLPSKTSTPCTPKLDDLLQQKCGGETQ